MSAPFAEVVGDPIEHSRSPLIHGFWLDALGMAGRYERTRVARGGLAAHLAARRTDPDWRGCNVTMPLKREALDAADHASDRALAAAAANLLVRREGRLEAANTDVGAIAALVDAQRQSGRPAERVVLLGSGGAARGALVALGLLGIRDVTLHARDAIAARGLAVEFGLTRPPQPLDAPWVGDSVVNATPLGMAGQTGWWCPPAELAAELSPRGWLFDMVTDPDETALIAAARARGLGIVTGRAMLIEQAATSFRLLFGVEPPRDAEHEAALVAQLAAS